MDAQMQAAIDNAVALALGQQQGGNQAAIDAAVAAALQQQQAVQQAAIDAAVAAAVAAMAPAQIPVQAAPPQQQPAAAVLPDLATPGELVGVLDYRNASGLKLYKSASAPLSTIFDGSATNLRLFLSDVTTRATSYGWMDTIFAVTCSDGVVRNFIESYGIIKMADIQLHVAQYMGPGIAVTRSLQASQQLQIMLQSSLSEELKAKVIARKAEYTFWQNKLDGVAMLKIVLTVVTMDTRATISVINTAFKTLNDKIQELDYDIEKFNLYVTDLIHQLTTRGQAVPLIIPELLAAYRRIPDVEFVDFIRKTKQDWLNNEAFDPSPADIMNLAFSQYQTLYMSGEWRAVSQQDQNIIALTAAVKKHLKGSTNNSSSNQPRPRVPYEPTGEWAWKAVAPKEGEPHEKKFKKKEYVYCPNHEGQVKWFLASGHKDGCRLDPKKKTADDKSITPSGTTTKDEGDKTKKKQIKYDKALAALMDAADDDSDDDTVNDGTGDN